MEAKSKIWLLLLFALLAIKINGYKQTNSYRNRRQHITQQQQNPSSYSNFNFNQFQSRQLDLSLFHQYLLSNNITVGENSQYHESGGWSDWSKPSECSRKCGGGIKTQSRICLDNNCVGPSKRYYSCNIHDCDPNEIDFRERQCSEYDSQPFKGRFFNWVPYLQTSKPCELNCMPSGERFYYRHSEKVIDGTKCYEDGSNDVCVEGQCMPVGCDKLLGSPRKEDKCGVCGGDGSSCQIIQGIFDSNQLKTGYNDIFTIPAGARNIKIEEIVPTSNYLAIRSVKGNYYLNGNWKIEFGRALKFASTVFNYVRRPQNGAEYLSATGPTNEPLIVVLLYQEPNRGITYEFSTKKNETQSIYDQSTSNEIDRMDRYSSNNNYLQSAQYTNRRPSHQFRWWHGEFTQCTKHCSGGQQQRRVVCLKISSNSQSLNISANELPSNSEIVSDEYCDARRKPAHIQNCNTHVCPPIWQVGHWSPCNCDNKTNTKIKVRPVFCKKGMLHPDTGIPLSDVWTIAGEEECNEVRGSDRKPLSVKECDENEECSVTTLSKVDLKDKKTADNNETATATLTEKKQNELDDLLNELATVPPFKKCEVTYAYKFIYSNWTKCDSRCGEGNQKRNASCIEIDPTNGKIINENKILSDIYCRHDKKLETERKCNEIPCVGVDWVTSEWSKCILETESTQTDDQSSVDIKPSQNEHLKNRTKLSSIQTRTVKCSTASGIIYSDELCGLNRKPETKKKCDKKQDVAQWLTSEWSSCSAIECGNGVRTRHVVCAVVDSEQKSIKVVDEKDCNENLKPKCEEECTGKQEICDQLVLLGPWSGCVDRCEETRSIICLAKNQTESIDCEDKYNHLGLSRKCENEDAKDSVDPQPTECKQEDLDKNCTTTEFGCCPGPDGMAAEGSNFKGCTIKLDEECEKSTFGCCQHDKSASFGPFQLGCTMNCNYTRYGCCHDKKTISLSPTLDDCLPFCASTEYGCCKDNSTASDTEKSNCPENAKKPLDKIEEDCIEEIAVVEGSGDDVIEGSGDDQVNDIKPVKVCKKKATTSCKDTKFGCCDDEKTIKLDENGLGCEVNKDNLTTTNEQSQPIKDIENKTDDSSTSAIETCQSSEFGCCADGVTTSQGPDMQGCTTSNISNTTKTASIETCQTSTHGCCPDMISYATGPDHLGCPCGSLQYGCCPDNQTPAKGPKFEGCDCRTSLHGCCSDGRTVAFGPGNLGCPDGQALDLQFSAPACSLPKERGTCRNFTVKWFFDPSYGGCSRFWYGGCSGNGNRFSTQDECEEICMKPKGSDACSLPLVNGSCTQYKAYWGYNTAKHICEQFNYGGCLGNNNKFETRENCEQTCYYSENNDPCEQQLQPGRCSDSLQRYFYNKLTNRCEPFVYTGCEGNKNNFITEEDCRNKCGARTAREICVLPVSTGNCLGKYPRYYFDFRSGTCKEFEYSGCSGNNNRFVDKESCEKLCNSTISYYPPYRNEIENDIRIIPSIPRISLEEDKKKSDVSATLSTLQYICNNNKDPGTCDGSDVKWYFNAIEKKCEQFYYSGCGGNANRFESRYDCEGRCIYQLSQYVRLQQELLLRQQQKIIEEQNQLRREQLEKQVILKQNICLQPRETGSCYKFVTRYYYDKDDKGCHKFYYSGCNGNDNNFATFEECTQRCGTPILTNNNDQTNRKQLAINEQLSLSFRTEDCFLQKERGPCDNDEAKWFYDSQDGVCKLFYWSGNRFNNGRECQTKCWGSQNICILPKVIGPCNGNFSQWYYSEEVKDCLEFTYSGCQGNANRFSSKEMCLEACSSQSQNNYPKIHHDHPNDKKASDICHLKPEKGDGTEYLERNYYDPVQNTCKIFIYSGLGGNRNNFLSRKECELQCADSHKFESPEPNDLSKRQEICLRQPEKGDCHNRVARWYYDPSSFTCLSFVYSGCGGNLNKFLTFDNCYKFCGGVKSKLDDDLSYNNLLPTTQQPTLAPYSPQNYSPTPPPVPTLEERPPQVLPSDCPIENCNNQRCTFGIDHYTDSRGCPKCRCSHPCHIHPCPKNQRCAVEVYRTESGQPLVQPICRLINKPGQCPLPVVLSQITGNCETNCKIDADCRGLDKCCSNGCANICASIQATNEVIEDTSEESEKLTQKVKLNDQTVLNCGLIPAKTEVSVAWNKDSRPVLQTTSALQNRIQILANGSLLIIQTRLEDNGEYTCSYAKRETSELVTKRRIIEVYDPVSILTGPRQVIATLNQPSVLECNARGIPKPIVTWWKDKRMLPISSTKYQQNSENYQLRINSVSNSDALYICQAHNDYGPIKVWDVTLLLEFEPNLHTPKIPELSDNSIYVPSRTIIQQQQTRLDGSSQDKLSQIYVRQGQIIQVPSNRFSMDGRPIPSPQEPLTVKTRLANEEYKTGSSLRIECVTNQPANITWYYNNEPIETSIQLNNLARRELRYAVVQNPDNSISIDHLIRQHSGSYKCKASNDFSYALSDLSIEVEDVPLPSKCRDSPHYLNCQTIVAFRYCSNKTYFTYCCKSCVLSKQVSIEEVRSRLT